MVLELWPRTDSCMMNQDLSSFVNRAGGCMQSGVHQSAGVCEDGKDGRGRYEDRVRLSASLRGVYGWVGAEVGEGADMRELAVPLLAGGVLEFQSCCFSSPPCTYLLFFNLMTIF